MGSKVNSYHIHSMAGVWKYSQLRLDASCCDLELSFHVYIHLPIHILAEIGQFQSAHPLLPPVSIVHTTIHGRHHVPQSLRSLHHWELRLHHMYVAIPLACHREECDGRLDLCQRDLSLSYTTPIARRQCHMRHRNLCDNHFKPLACHSQVHLVFGTELSGCVNIYII